MKKISIILIVLASFSTFMSCGPKRHGCGPGRRCEIKSPQKQMDLMENNKKHFC